MLTVFDETKIENFIKQQKEVRFADIFPWAVEQKIEHPDVCVKLLIDAQRIAVDYHRGLYVAL